MEEPVDIAILGSGIACTSTLIEVFRKLIAGIPNQRKITITVIEKNREFWLGIPYGSRSSVNALTITSVYGFFTNEQERSRFFDWFGINKDELFTYYLEKGGLTAEQWLARNKEAIANEDYKNVYLPRFMCGRYQQSKFNSLLKTVNDKQLATLNLITAEAIDIQPAGSGYEVTYENTDKSITTLNATKVVIATGSAPVKDVLQNVEGITYINNLYEPGAEANITIIAATLAAVENMVDRNVLLVGSNASSIELLYLLAGMPGLTTLINKLLVVSRSGLFPYHIINQTLDSYPCQNLDKLAAAGNYTITTLVDAAAKDIKVAVKDGVIVAYIDRVIGYTMELLQPLGEGAKKQFLGIYGMQLSNQFRRSGTDYKGGETALLAMEKLTMLKGSFVSIDDSGLLHYTATETNIAETYPTPFKVVINCTGANDLAESSSRLIYNLVHNKIAEVNLSGKGFYVNEKFEAAPNLHVMGPLLGGNMNERIHFWHLENASRLMYLAPYLADCLL